MIKLYKRENNQTIRQATSKRHLSIEDIISSQKINIQAKNTTASDKLFDLNQFIEIDLRKIKENVHEGIVYYKLDEDYKADKHDKHSTSFIHAIYKVPAQRIPVQPPVYNYYSWGLHRNSKRTKELIEKEHKNLPIPDLYVHFRIQSRKDRKSVNNFQIFIEAENLQYVPLFNLYSIDNSAIQKYFRINVENTTTQKVCTNEAYNLYLNDFSKLINLNQIREMVYKTLIEDGNLDLDNFRAIYHSNIIDAILKTDKFKHIVKNHPDIGGRSYEEFSNQRFLLDVLTYKLKNSELTEFYKKLDTFYRQYSTIQKQNFTKFLETCRPDLNIKIFDEFIDLFDPNDLQYILIR